MLAHDGAKHPKKIKGDCLVEYKYDGVRVIGIVKNGQAILYSRNGKIFTNFPHIEEALSKLEYNNLVFDGEIMSDDFQALMKQVYRKSGAKTDDAYLALFDILPLKEFNKGISKLNTIERKEQLNKFSKTFDSSIKLVDYGYNVNKLEYKSLLHEGYIEEIVKRYDLSNIHLVDVVDYELRSRIRDAKRNTGVKLSWYDSPNFLLTSSEIESDFKEKMGF